MMFPKAERLRQRKMRLARQYATARKACVDAVWTRAEHCCESCGRWVVRPRDTDNPFAVGHVHETVPRSLGGDPTNPDDCRLLCVECHYRAHRVIGDL
jgi:5-methylcytosine-specific restriction endonuclease McrA